MASSLPLIPQFFEKFIQNWSDKRQPDINNQITLSRHQLYILPTRHGVIYFFVLLLILFGSINYEISLGYMLTFLLGSLGLPGMIYAHQNLNRLNIKIGRAEPVFAQQDILFPLQLSQCTATSHANIELLSETGQTVAAHLINKSSTECKLPVTTTHRGYISPGRIKIYTEYPLGLFHAWSWLKFDTQCLVYPAPSLQHQPLMFVDEQNTGQTSSELQGVDDFLGIRQYHSGDLPNHMAWKAIAKTGELQTKLFNTDTARKVSINWNQTRETLDIEHRLSILCRMILDASEKSIIYGLEIPGVSIAPSSGLQHKHRCLKALALFGHI
ncbi:MAG: DUF58 domain-containing protein [Gammaproteobacteria bacterium]|nr:DUF58 domain-containing protein [Gammaproteobacteria bacterium]